MNATITFYHGTMPRTTEPVDLARQFLEVYRPAKPRPVAPFSGQGCRGGEVTITAVREQG